MLKIIAGLIGVVVGALMVWKPQKFLEMVGEQRWMIKIFGEGHATEGYKALGIIIVFVSALIMTGLVEGILLWFFSPMMPN